MFGDPILGAGVDELLDDLRAAIERGDVPQLDADYMAGAMAGVALELGVRMAERDPADVDGAARFATELFLGGIARLGTRLATWRGRAGRARIRSSSISSAPRWNGSAIGLAPSSGSAARRRPSTSATSVGTARRRR